jgi:hypothetical protein
MRKTLMATALVLALCCTTFAGEMHTPPVAPDPPPNTTQEQNTDSNTVVTNSLIQTVLDVIVSVLP